MNISTEEIKNKIIKYIKDEYYQGPDDELTDDLPLISSGMIDSISTLQVVEHLEKTFGFEFEPNEVEYDNLDSIAKMVVFVESKLS